jgi:hypothetical protein
MVLNLYRAKTNGTQQLNVFLHHHNWTICPMHALGSMIAVNKKASHRVFPGVVKKNESKHVNKVLKGLYEEWVLQGGLEKNNGVPLGEAPDSPFMLYTSHAQRHGSAESSNEHPDIQTQWIIPRGAWTLDQIQTLFNYIAGTAKSDKYLGRVLAGWPSATAGGFCPGDKVLCCIVL